ncbi:PQQ-binding-like beta-propeller repeat protein [Haladaptatus sp. F3-133]|uniref:PQQ-binding-like beta-propeller repeat protein n=1 Tax=Halorutilus salinus TaxID=2487751 RepID=A0A9Q4GJN4_9EURY|nr:PQQ-binding-like beta-propeller repeat protein [Halorutilus salinus]MCX2819396.1 PQQ-binding-like beta-propeller repeat protein [Halorutilus salinus]
MDDEMTERVDSISRRELILTALASGSLSGCIESGEDTGSDTVGVGSQGGTESGEVNPNNLLPDLSWEFETQGKVMGSPAVTDSSVYVGSFDGYLYALGGVRGDGLDEVEYTQFGYNHRNTGSVDATPPTELEERWKISTEGAVYNAPAVVQGNLYFGSEDRYFYSVSAETGRENWKIDAGGVVANASPTVVGEVVYFTSGHSGVEGVKPNGRINAVNSDTGEYLWRKEREGSIASAPTVHNGTLYHGCQDEKLYAVDVESGKDMWSFQADGVFCGSVPAVMNNIVYAGSEDNSMYALNADDGSLVWEFETGHIIVSSPVVTEEAVYFGSYDDNLYAVDPETGDELWRFNAGSSIFSSPAYRDGVVYFGTESGWLFAVDGRTGEEVWSIEQSADRHHAVKSSPVVTENMVYFGTEGNSVYGVRNRSVGEEEYEESESTLTIRNG